MGEIKQSPGSSPSKAINDNAKKNWKGGLDHGSTDAKGILGQAHNKHPLPTPSKDKKS
jgi:hypothetical protein